MAKERSASRLIERQQDQQIQFLQDLAKRLNRANYKWEDQLAYVRPSDPMVYRGLIIKSDTRFNRVDVLTPAGNVVTLEAGRGLLYEWTEEHVFRASAHGFLQDAENVVASALISHQEKQVVATVV